MEKDSSAKQSRKLFREKDGVEVLQIGIDIVTTSSFKIDVPTSSKSIELGV